MTPTSGPGDDNARRWEDEAGGGDEGGDLHATGGGRTPRPDGLSRGGGGPRGGRRTPFGGTQGTGWWEGTLAEWFDEAGNPLERPIMPTDHLAVAREFLMAKCQVPGSQQFGLGQWADKFWVYERGGYTQRGKGEIVNAVQHWLSGCDKRMRRQKKPIVCAHSPSRDYCAAVAESLSVDTFIAGVRDLPAWLPPMLDVEGRPMWGARSRLVDQAWRRADESRGNPANLLIYENGMIDLGEIAETMVARTRPHTPDLFSMAALPYAFPIDALRELLAGPQDGPGRRELEERVYSRICPGWWAFVKSASVPPAPEDGGTGGQAAAEAAHEDGCSDVPDENGETAAEADAAPDWEWVDHLQETFGDTLDPDRSIEIVNAVVGDKRTGKDTILMAVSTVLGDGNWCALSPQDFGDRFGLYKTVGKKAALMGEMDLGKHDDATAIMAMMKTMSGKSPMSVRDLYTSPIDIRSTSRLWFAANTLPAAMRDPSGAFASRLNMIRMRRSWLGKENEKVKGNVPAEGPGISVWAVMGAVRVRVRAMREGRRYVAQHQASVELREKYERVSSTLRVFLKECCQEAETYEEEFGALYNAYTHLCKQEGVMPTGKAKFSIDIELLVPWYKRGKQPVRRAEDGTTSRKRWVLGVRLRHDLDPAWRHEPEKEQKDQRPE